VLRWWRRVEDSLEELCDVVREKLALDADAEVQMRWMHDDEAMFLDDGECVGVLPLRL
jgi:hypothetical protein